MSKIVFKGQTESGTPYIIRYPKRTDVKELQRYINELSKEKTFILLQGEQMSFEDERNYVNSSLKRIRDKETVQLLVESNNTIVGNAEINSRKRVNHHVGTLGISITKDFRGRGIGKKLLEVLIDEVQQNLPYIKIVHLECFANNQTACSLYKSLGFKEYGILPKGIVYKEEFVDEILMYKEI